MFVAFKLQQSSRVFGKRGKFSRPGLCRILSILYFDVLSCDVNFSRFSSQVFFTFLLKHDKLDSQGEIVPTELPNPEETQIWDGENKSVRSRQHLVLPLLLVISSFIRQARIGCYGNGLIDVKEKPQILKRV